MGSWRKQTKKWVSFLGDPLKLVVFLVDSLRTTKARRALQKDRPECSRADIFSQNGFLPYTQTAERCSYSNSLVGVPCSKCFNAPACRPHAKKLGRQAQKSHPRDLLPRTKPPNRCLPKKTPTLCLLRRHQTTWATWNDLLGPSDGPDVKVRRPACIANRAGAARAPRLHWTPGRRRSTAWGPAQGRGMSGHTISSLAAKSKAARSALKEAAHFEDSGRKGKLSQPRSLPSATSGS